jgi:hypothetical protein
MAAIRYQSTIKNYDNIEYRISIYDKSYSGSILTDFLVDENGFELKYDSGEDTNFAPIIGGELTLNLVLAKNAQRDDTTLFTFLKNMVQQNSQTYYIIIEEKVSGSWVEYWRGNVVQNQSAWNNDALESGCMFQIIANDFAYLNEQIVGYSSTANSLFALRILTNYAINTMGVWDDLPQTATVLSHNINWYEIGMTGRPNVDVLGMTLSKGSNFNELSEDRTQNTIKVIEILKTIATLFGCRMIYSKGQIWMIQIQNYTNSSVKFYNTDFLGTTLSTTNIAPRVAVSNSSGPLKILAGGQYNTIRPTYSVFIKKPSLNSILFQYPKTVLNSNKLEYTVGNSFLFGGGGNNKLKIVVNIKNEYFDNLGIRYISTETGTATVLLNAITAKVLKLKVRIKKGSTYYYLNRISVNNYTWVTTNTTCSIPFLLPTANNNAEEMNLYMFTPIMPSGDFSEVLVEANPYYTGWDGISGTTGSGDGIFTGSFSCKYCENGSDENEEVTYRASITPKPFDPKELELPEILLYDSAVNVPKGGMQLNVSGNPLTNEWVVGNAGSSPSVTYNIFELIVINAMAMNRSSKQIISATIRGQYYPHQLLTYDSKQWHLKQATYNANKNEWNGEWFELTYDSTTVAISKITNTGNSNDNALA